MLCGSHLDGNVNGTEERRRAQTRCEPRSSTFCNVPTVGLLTEPREAAAAVWAPQPQASRQAREPPLHSAPCWPGLLLQRDRRAPGPAGTPPPGVRANGPPPVTTWRGKESRDKEPPRGRVSVTPRQRPGPALVWWGPPACDGRGRWGPHATLQVQGPPAQRQHTRDPAASSRPRGLDRARHARRQLAWVPCPSALHLAPSPAGSSRIQPLQPECPFWKAALAGGCPLQERKAGVLEGFRPRQASRDRAGEGSGRPAGSHPRGPLGTWLAAGGLWPPAATMPRA